MFLIFFIFSQVESELNDHAWSYMVFNFVNCMNAKHALDL